MSIGDRPPISGNPNLPGNSSTHENNRPEALPINAQEKIGNPNRKDGKKPPKRATVANTTGTPSKAQAVAQKEGVTPSATKGTESPRKSLELFSDLKPEHGDNVAAAMTGEAPDSATVEAATEAIKLAMGGVDPADQGDARQAIKDTVTYLMTPEGQADLDKTLDAADDPSKKTGKGNKLESLVKNAFSKVKNPFKQGEGQKGFWGRHYNKHWEGPPGVGAGDGGTIWGSNVRAAMTLSDDPWDKFWIGAMVLFGLTDYVPELKNYLDVLRDQQKIQARHAAQADQNSHLPTQSSELESSNKIEGAAKGSKAKANNIEGANEPSEATDTNTVDPNTNPDGTPRNRTP